MTRRRKLGLRRLSELRRTIQREIRSAARSARTLEELDTVGNDGRRLRVALERAADRLRLPPKSATS